ncbi:hypothetical protein BDN71DRAFT_808365 [Pleurotus eryngii]|uniref:Uncharacterized protein n=1 Tax=Pleurotus eryngii TaxID=5323 RepID=A0A9P6DFX6_PLEER|nr:hypothetical protein BDN71DRAFT_808365 [Pleurotus eryngii]
MRNFNWEVSLPRLSYCCVVVQAPECSGTATISLSASTRSHPAYDMHSRATGQVIATPELPHLICEYCNLKENHNALVSKTWSNEAPSVLWHELDSLGPLLSLLAPLKVVNNCVYEFCRHIRPSDWIIFQKCPRYQL